MKEKFILLILLLLSLMVVGACGEDSGSQDNSSSKLSDPMNTESALNEDQSEDTSNPPYEDAIKAYKAVVR